MSYNSIATALAYLQANKLYIDAWTEEEEPQHTIALNMAFNIIEQLPYKGYRSVEDQDNSFPRDGETTVPTKVLWAEAEIAYSILDDIDPESEARQGEIKAASFTTIKTTYGSHALWRAYGVPSATAWKYLTPYISFSETIELAKV